MNNSTANTSHSSTSFHPSIAGDSEIGPPSLGLLLIEGRALGELALTHVSRNFLMRGPDGDGHPVMVLPGFLASGISTRPLRNFLAEKGWDPYCWKQGRNLGLRGDLEDRMLDRMIELYERTGRKVSLIGWSLGGVYAREVARRSPEHVRQVITMGSPFAQPHKANHSWRLFNSLSEVTVDDAARERAERMQEAPPVPTTAIYSRTDGVTAWQCCTEKYGPETENIEVEGAHCGLGVNPLVLHAISDRLSQSEGEWSHFRRSGRRRYFYSRPRYPRG